MKDYFEKYTRAVNNTDTIKYTGTVCAVQGLMIESNGPRSVIGEICYIEVSKLNKTILAEVIGLENKTVKLMAYTQLEGIEIGDKVIASGNVLQVGVGENLLGRILDGTGKAIDGLGDIVPETFYPVSKEAPNSLTRKEISERIVTGVRSIDSLCAVGKGQRIGVFAGSGVGKSTILSMIARNTNAEVNVIGLIGERGREVLDFLRHDLGNEGLKRSVLVIATGDQSPIAKLRAAYVTTAIAEYFRDQGKDVMLMMDTITRFAHAQRDIGSSLGETPQRRGYPASTFTKIQQLLERTGTNDKGSITAFYTVLVDGGDFDEPVSDTVRGILDGHIMLSPDLVRKQHYPAVDVLESISRCAGKVTGPETQKAVRQVKKWIADYQNREDMIESGIYVKGSSAEIDEAIEKHAEIEKYLIQDPYDKGSMEETIKGLTALTGIEIPEEEYK